MIPIKILSSEFTLYIVSGGKEMKVELYYEKIHSLINKALQAFKITT